MSEVPVHVIDEFEVRKVEGIFNESGELVLDGLCPFAHENDELVDVPRDASAGNLGVVALELRVFVFGLCQKVFFCPYLTMQVRVIDEWQAFVGRFLHLFWSELFLADAKEIVFLDIVPEDAYRWHFFVKGCHIGHLLVMQVFVQ